MRRIIKIVNIGIVVVGLLVPLALFLNRFLIPDVSYDSLNYHLYLGYKAFNTSNNKFEFYPTGIHNFSPILDAPGYLLMRIFGYRLGSIASLIFLYLSILVLYKIFRLYQPKYKIWEKWWGGFFLVSSFLSFEAFLQIAIYFVDIEVVFWSLLSLYLLLKCEKSRSLVDLIFSSISMGIVFLGKLTTGYLLVPYFVYLGVILLADKKITWLRKVGMFVLSVAIIFSFSLSFFWRNYNLTKNPVFPYYNGFFKSDYYSKNSFSQEASGGDTTLDKIFWGVVSIWQPEKLGQAHDLFNDYKINLYFVSALVILVWSVVKRDKDLSRLSALYLFCFELWAWVFGYIRYGIILELLGGLILLLWLTKLKGSGKYVVIIPLFLFLGLQNKRIVNMSLAYDLSFRPGYFYNRQSYPTELINFNKNSISIDKSLILKYKPTVYLNCATPGMSYQILSDFRNLPVLNIDRNFYAGMTNNKFYIEESSELLKKFAGEKVSFVTIVTTKGLNTTYDACIRNLQDRGYEINTQVESNFLGYRDQGLKIIFGQFNW